MSGGGIRMRVIIIGWNRAEDTKIKDKDFDKHFFQERKQCYRIFPDGLTRMRIFKDGVEQESDEVIVFPENGIIPHLTRGLDYSPEAIKSDIDFHKNATATGFMNRFKLFINASSSIYWGVAPYLGLIITGIIVGCAFLGVI